MILDLLPFKPLEATQVQTLPLQKRVLNLVSGNAKFTASAAKVLSCILASAFKERDTESDSKMAMVDAVIFSLLNNVTQLLARETNLIRGVKDEIISFQGELRFINQFLRNSEGKRDRVKEVVSQIRDVALEAEDVIDTFVINMARHKRRNRVQKFWYGWNHITMLRGVGTDILTIKNRVKEIYENKDKYDIENKEVAASGEASEKILIQRWRRDVEEDEVVGFEKDVEAVIEKLKTKIPRRDVVSIIGLGGLGKTTLAKKIYKSDIVRCWFDCCAWVEVSQDYDTRQLLMKIVETVTPLSMENLTEEKLSEKMTEVLASKRYLIVLDDVWDTNLWDGIKSAFPDNGKGSRVLVTSRDREVASHASRTPPYFLPLLNEEESWSLFTKKVFPGENFPSELEELGRQIVMKCHGLPLAIVVVAGLLANREEPMWPKVAADLSWYLSQYPKKCLGILALSYESLPPKLKPCFLYLGVFPEDYEIPVRQLVRLWVSEGFVNQENSKNMEEVCEEYLYQLIDRSLIQVASRRTDGGMKTCRVHDLVRELSISMGIQEKFLEFHKQTDSGSTTKPRTVSINSGSSDLRYDYFLISDFSRVRSLLCIAEPWHLPALERDPFSLISRACRFLRVLDLSLNRCHEFPYKVEILIHLRYLRMRAGNHVVLPSSISKLPNIQTIDVRGTFSGNIWQMQELRHVFLRTTSFSSLPKDNDNITMPNLRTLSKLACWDEFAMNCLKTTKFPNLTKLGLLSNDKYFVIFDFLPNLHHLQTLRIEGKFRFTNFRSLPLSLTKITLKYTKLNSYVFPMLGEIPNLQVLKLLDYSVMGRDFCIKKGILFPRLQVLHMVNLVLEKWSMENGANCMQSLRFLLIDQCGNLEAIPDQLKHISSLRNMKLRSCPCLDEDELYRVWGNDSRCEVRNCRR